MYENIHTACDLYISIMYHQIRYSKYLVQNIQS